MRHVTISPLVQVSLLKIKYSSPELKTFSVYFLGFRNHRVKWDPITKDSAVRPSLSELYSVFKKYEYRIL